MAVADNTAELPVEDGPIEVEAGPAVERTPLQQVLDNIRNLSQQQKIAAGAAIALSIALIVGVLLWNREPGLAVLYANLDERDGGQVIAALQQQNIPYRMADNGNAILVPTEQVHETRLRLAAAGLPKGGLAGFELMDGQKLGISQFNEQVNYQRGLEGELSRTIQSIGIVDAARVHLALPRRTAFLRDEQKPTASVMLNLRPGRSLNENQVAGIVHLVSSSVPHMNADGVKVIDQDGKLLTDQADPLMRAGLNASQLQYVRMIEDGLIERVNNILVPLFGQDNFRAQITADVDFNQVEQTAETYKPNPAPDQAIRSQQTTEAINPLQGPQGIPGALTNQPPVPATAPLSIPPVGPDQAAQGMVSSNRSAVLNYELDRSIQHIKQSVGQIKRLSVAVVINNRSLLDAEGKRQQVPLTDEEISRITNVVRDAVGYNASRGDSINVANNAFAGEDDAGPLPFWKDPALLEFGQEHMNSLIILIIVLLTFFGVIRPLLRAVLPPKEKPGKDAEAGAGDGEESAEDADAIVSLSGEGEDEEEEDEEDEDEENSYESRLARVRELARENPKTVANLIKEWMTPNEEGRK
ncbi:MAG: flagellar basal-body MS-ring/collar protein FliF [Thauera sp.]|jgi:flagellar M-ring protein FliF|nr:flagellar basal-body MS-ring/collar protein FliF [Thauera sp.]